MLLNEEYSFSDVRYQITANSAYTRGYDVELSFVGYPEKVRLEPGTVLVRLDFAVVVAGYFFAAWWMRDKVLQTLLHSADSNATALRREWQPDVDAQGQQRLSHPSDRDRTHCTRLRMDWEGERVI
jgi:hypothetical protein